MVIVSVILFISIVVGFIAVYRNLKYIQRLDKDIDSKIDMGVDKRVEDIEVMQERIANDKEEIRALSDSIKNVEKRIKTVPLTKQDNKLIENTVNSIELIKSDIRSTESQLERIMSRQDELNQNTNSLKQYI